MDTSFLGGLLTTEKIGRDRALDMLKTCLNYVVEDRCEGAEALDVFYSLGISNSELHALGFDFLLDLKPHSYEKIFIEFLSMLQFRLNKYDDGFGLVDITGSNLNGIEQDRFESASEIFERLDNYIYDSIITDIDDALEEKNVEITWGESCEDYLKHAKAFLPDDRYSFDILDMICNHFEEIDLNKAILQY